MTQDQTDRIKKVVDNHFKWFIPNNFKWENVKSTQVEGIGFGKEIFVKNNQPDPWPQIDAIHEIQKGYLYEKMSYMEWEHYMMSLRHDKMRLWDQFEKGQ